MDSIYLQICIAENEDPICLPLKKVTESKYALDSTESHYTLYNV